MFKKYLSFILIALMLLTMLPGAFADDEEDYTWATTPMKYLKSYHDWEKVRDTYAPISGDLRTDILTVARSQIGNCASKKNTKYVEGYGTKHWTLYGDFMGSPYCEWCDAFASFCAYYGGAGDYPLEISCMRHEFALKKAGYWRDWNQYIPKPGDLVFFALSDYTNASHAGVVERVVAKRGDRKAYLVTIEGNVGVSNGNGCSGVARCIRYFDDVVGYGTYEKGEVREQKLTPHPNGNPGGEINDAYNQTSVPVKEFLIFIGADQTPYYYYWFPEEKLLQVSTSQNEEPEPEPESDLPPETDTENIPADASNKNENVPGNTIAPEPSAPPPAKENNEKPAAPVAPKPPIKEQEVEATIASVDNMKQKLKFGFGIKND